MVTVLNICLQAVVLDKEMCSEIAKEEVFPEEGIVELMCEK